MSKVLLVSKDEKKAKEFQEILQKNSLEFLYADNQLMTVDILKTQLPDIVILDSNTQGLDLKAINKKIKNFDNVLTILLLDNNPADPEILKTSNAFYKSLYLKSF